MRWKAGGRVQSFRVASAFVAVLALSVGMPASAADGSSSAAAGPPPAFIRLVPAGQWRLNWQLGHRVERQTPGSPWLEYVADHLVAGLELTRRFVWEGDGVTWKAEVSARAVVARKHEKLTDLFGVSVENSDWTSRLWFSRLTLSAFRSNLPSGRGVEVAATLFFEGPPDSAATPGDTIGLTLSQIMDPAIVAVSAAMTAGPGDGAALYGAGEWRLVVTDQFAIFTGAAASWFFNSAVFNARIWTGVSLSRRDGAELGVLVERPLDGRGEFALQVEVLLPGSTAARAGPEALQ